MLSTLKEDVVRSRVASQVGREETGLSIDVPVVDAAEDAVNERDERCKLHQFRHKNHFIIKTD